jgi:hypothetical protein
MLKKMVGQRRFSDDAHGEPTSDDGHHILNFPSIGRLAWMSTVVWIKALGSLS